MNKSQCGPNKIHVSIERQKESLPNPSNSQSNNNSVKQLRSKFSAQVQDSPTDNTLSSIKGISFSKSPTNRLFTRQESKKGSNKNDNNNNNNNSLLKGKHERDILSKNKKSQFGLLEEKKKKLSNITGKYNKNQIAKGTENNSSKNDNISSSPVMSLSNNKDNVKNSQTIESIKQTFYKLQESSAIIIQKAFRKYRKVSINSQSKI